MMPFDERNAEELNKETMEMRRMEHPQHCVECDRLKEKNSDWRERFDRVNTALEEVKASKTKLIEWLQEIIDRAESGNLHEAPILAANAIAEAKKEKR